MFHRVVCRCHRAAAVTVSRSVTSLRHVVALHRRVASSCVASRRRVAPSHRVVCSRHCASVTSRRRVAPCRHVMSLHLVVCCRCCAAVASRRSCHRRHAGVASRNCFVAPRRHAASSCRRRVVASSRRVVALRHMPSLSCLRHVPSSRRPGLSCLVASVSPVTSLTRRHPHRPTVLGWLLRLSPLPLAVAVSCVVSRRFPPRVVSLLPCLCLTCRIVAWHRAHPSRSRVVAISRVAPCPLAVSPSHHPS